jgi:hypothetical protein
MVDHEGMKDGYVLVVLHPVHCNEREAPGRESLGVPVPVAVGAGELQRK